MINQMKLDKSVKLSDEQLDEVTGGYLPRFFGNGRYIYELSMAASQDRWPRAGYRSRKAKRRLQRKIDNCVKGDCEHAAH